MANDAEFAIRRAEAAERERDEAVAREREYVKALERIVFLPYDVMCEPEEDLRDVKEIARAALVVAGRPRNQQLADALPALERMSEELGDVAEPPKEEK